MAMSALTVDIDFLVRKQSGAQRLVSRARPNDLSIYANPDNFPNTWSRPHEIFSSTA